MEVIVPLFIVFISSFVAAGVVSRLTKPWTRGRGAAIVAAFFLPGLYVGYLLGALHLRDDYHRRRAETYNFDGNCVVALGHGYRLGFFDEFPEFSRVVHDASGAAANYNDNGSSVSLVENGVRRVGLTALGVCGGGTGREDPLNEAIDHYFCIDFAQGKVERFETEFELRSKMPGLGRLVSPDELFSNQEKKERSTLVTWTIFLLPIVFLVSGCYQLRRWQTTPPRGGPSFLPSPSRD